MCSSTVFYCIRIFNSAHTNSVRIRRNSTSSERKNSINFMSTERKNSINIIMTNTKELEVPQGGLYRTPSIWSQMSELRSKLSNASTLLPLYRDDTRAASVTVLIVMVVGVTWTPHITNIIMTSIILHHPPSWLYHLSVAMLSFYSVLSPVIFAFRSRRVQRDVRRVLRIKPRLSKHQKILNKLKSYSCPHLVLTSCQSLQVFVLYK